MIFFGLVIGTLPNKYNLQHRVAQETIIIKDEQLREAQAWITRVQEMDALQSTTTHSLQAELRERTEQYNQLWLGCQRQVCMHFGLIFFTHSGFFFNSLPFSGVHICF